MHITCRQVPLRIGAWETKEYVNEEYVNELGNHGNMLINIHKGFVRVGQFKTSSEDYKGTR